MKHVTIKEEIIIEIRNELIKERERLANIAVISKNNMANMPEGKLRINKSKGNVQYYNCTRESTKNGVYISKENMDLVKKLAQKSYNEKIYKYTENVVSQIDKLLKIYEDNKIEDIYLAEKSERQELITPVEETYKHRLEEWISVPYKSKGFNEEMPVILTNKGVRVRSKSEKIMADYFESVGIIYKYECPIWLNPYGTIYPDFTFLSRKTGKEIYWEHEGKMDNPDYARTAVQKISMYESNGLFPGEDLILTFETSNSVVSTELIKKMTEKYLI